MVWNTAAVYHRNTTFGLPGRWFVAAVLLLLVVLLTAVTLTQRYGGACEGSSSEAAVVCLLPVQREIVPRPLPGHAPAPRTDFHAMTS